MIKIDGKKIRHNKLYIEIHYSFSRFKFLINFYRILTLFVLQTRTKTLTALYQGQLLSDTVPVHLMLYTVCGLASNQKI